MAGILAAFARLLLKIEDTEKLYLNWSAGQNPEVQKERIAHILKCETNEGSKYREGHNKDRPQDSTKMIWNTKKVETCFLLKTNS